jgi:hypothetical protein
MSDEELIAEVKRLAGCERDATARLVTHLAELDARRLYLGAGFPSLFAYCTTALRLSENEAYNRIEAARTARRFPVLFALLQDGRVNLTTVRLLGSHLSAENHEELLSAASGRSRREVEQLLARRFPQPVVPTSIRKLPEARPAVTIPMPPPASDPGSEAPLSPAPAAQPPPTRRAVIAPLTQDQYKVMFTARAETCQKLRLAQDLLRHQIPDGSPAEIFDLALSALLEGLARKKLAATSQPRPSRGSSPGSRHIPAQVKRAVWLRDGGRCAFLAKDGRRCDERGFLEFHHVTPFAAGGVAGTGNIALRCRAHNGFEADLYFGPRQPLRPETQLVLERVIHPTGSTTNRNEAGATVGGRARYQ